MSEVEALADTAPAWATWAEPHELGPYTVGIEEEVMLLDATSWALAHRIDSVLPRLPRAGSESFTAETHGSALEIQTGVHGRIDSAVEELATLRGELDAVLRPLSMRAASAGTHPFAVWQEIVVSAGERYQFVYGSMRELARREPTFGLHVHVGVPGAEAAIHAANRLRTHIPLLLALSVNSPFWQGRDTGLASARTIDCTRAAIAADSPSFVCASMIRTSTVPKRGCGRTSHQRKVGSGTASQRISTSTVSTYSA